MLPTLLSAPLLTMGPPPPPEALRPGDVKLVVFGEGRKAALKRTKSNSGAEISGGCSVSFTKNRPWQRPLLWAEPPSPPLAEPGTPLPS